MGSKKHLIKTDCRYYKGSTPCLFHKQSGLICESCNHYAPLKGRILIIKLGAAGDVIRTTPLLRKLKENYPDYEISWLTCFPDFLSPKWVDNILELNLSNTLWLTEQKFDWVINLDKDKEAIALTRKLTASKKSGYTMNDFGKCMPISSNAEKHKWLTGLNDNISRANTKNYMEEIFEICGYKFNKENYVLELDGKQDWKSIDKSKKIVGLNCGCGERWVSRLWPEKKWIELSKLLREKDYEIILFGGPQEDKKNKGISKKAGVKYLGYFPLRTFCSLVNQCDIVITQVSMATHIAIALNKKLILMNNIFNKNEFYLYGNGAIIEPELDCLGCYKPQQDKNCPVESCMDLITVQKIYNMVQGF